MGFKIIPLLKQGADIVVVSPELDANLVKLVEEKKFVGIKGSMKK